MNIIKNIIEELVRSVENDKIKYTFSNYEDSCNITFGKKEIKISNYYNMAQKHLYYQVHISDALRDFNDYNIVIESKSAELFKRTKYLYELVKTKYLESDPYLQSILSELKSGIFEEGNTKTEVMRDDANNSNDILPF